MKIIEIRDGFIKFEADKSIYLSSFIQVDGETKSYIAQVNQCKAFGEISIASAKILFLLVNGMLQNYDKTEPSKDAEIKIFTHDILNNSINAKNPVIIGKTLDNASSIKIDSSAFNKKMLISIDEKNMNETLIRNFSKQFENLGINTIVLDTLGIIGAKKYKAGVDFKLPLDTASLAFMYESCLNDVTSESKSVIVEIFKDLSEYSKTVPFVPFSALKSIVDDMVDNQHIFKLLVLKNKLAKYEKLGYFASAQSEVDSLDKFLSQKNSVIDLSGMDVLFQNRYLAYIYAKLEEYKNIQVFLQTANTVSKKNLKHIIADSEIPTTLVTHSRFQYLNDIKNMFDNFIIEPTITNNTVFNIYSTFLNSMQKDMYLTAGEAINYIPIVSKIQIIDEVAEPNEIMSGNEQEEIPESVEKISEEQILAEEDSNSKEDDSEIINVSIDEPDIENNSVNKEILAAINEKSKSAIDAIAESIDEPKEVELFDDEDLIEQEESDNSDAPEDIYEVAGEEESDALSVNDIEMEDSTEVLSELENDVQEENLASDLAEINESAVNISEVPNDEMIVDDSYNNEEPTEELLGEDEEDDLNIETADIESFSEENTEISEDELLTDVQDSEQSENMDDLGSEELVLDDGNGDSAIELESDVEDLLNEQGADEEIYPQNTTLDVDFSEPNVMPLTGEASDHDFDEIVELDPSDSSSDDIVIDMSGDEQININEEREQEILEEVDKVYTTRKDDDELEEISDSDLDMIDELNSDVDELEEYNGELEEVSDSDNGIIKESHAEPASKNNDADEILEHKESNTPIVPMYDADIPQEDMVVSDPIQQGDAVVHAKYGNGVVEKMIKYGNKTLFAINFENIGRRLLDPTLTEIKRV